MILYLSGDEAGISVDRVGNSVHEPEDQLVEIRIVE